MFAWRNLISLTLSRMFHKSMYMHMCMKGKYICIVLYCEKKYYHQTCRHVLCCFVVDPDYHILAGLKKVMHKLTGTSSLHPFVCRMHVHHYMNTYVQYDFTAVIPSYEHLNSLCCRPSYMYIPILYTML